MENGLVNLINRLPEDKFRHAIICLTESTAFSSRISRSGVEIHEIHKRPGQDWLSLVTVYRLLCRLKPAIVHTRNLAAIEYQLCALLAGVRHRIHGEHGWDVFDPDGGNVKYQWLRRIVGMVIHRFIPLSLQLEHYLLDRVGIAPGKISRICNGVDTQVFYPRSGSKTLIEGCHVDLDGKIAIGTVGRMHGVKDQLTLVRAFIAACKQSSEFSARAVLVVVGDGPLRQPALQLLAERGVADQTWLPGERSDVAEILRNLDIFVLPSQSEGISNTILEAMASGLPVIATAVGGNPELVVDGECGRWVEKQNPEAMATALLELTLDDDKRKSWGNAARQRAEREFSIDTMVARYRQVYEQLL